MGILFTFAFVALIALIGVADLNLTYTLPLMIVGIGLPAAIAFLIGLRIHDNKKYGNPKATK